MSSKYSTEYMASDSRKFLENWLKTIDIGDKSVIDFGGVCFPAKNRTKNPIKNYSILDIRPERKGVKADYVFDMNKPINGIPKCDVGFCLEVMQFLYEPLQALWNMKWVCKEIYVNFHLFHIPCEGTDYLRYTEKGVRQLLKESRWEIESITPRMENGVAVSWYVHAK